MEAFYKQCRLKRRNASTVTWLPEKFAVAGRFVKLKEEDGSWSDGWQVEEVGPVRMEERYVVANSRDHLKTREASDI